VETWVVPEPCLHGRGLVGLIVIADEVDLEAFSHFGVDLGPGVGGGLGGQ
jgi:hypothetical protein